MWLIMVTFFPTKPELSLALLNSVTDKYCPQLLLPVKSWSAATESYISLDKAAHINVGKIYILAPVFAWDKQTFLFIEKAGHEIAGSKYCFTTTHASQIMNWS